MIRNGTTLPGRSPAHQEVVGALDQACAIWGLAGGDGRSRFIQHCLRYGLLSLLDAGVLEFSEATESEFVRHYRSIEARLAAAGASATGQPMPREFTESKRAFRRAMEAFRPPPFLRAVRAAPAASRLQPAPPIGLLVWIGEGVQDFPVFLNELDPCQVRPRRRRNVLPGNFAAQHVPQQLVEPPVMPLAEQALPLRVLADRQLRTAAAAAHRSE